ncbi:type I-D CRISPR-associated protein Cas5/Csc1 [Baaleninema simplex]|uniref:type I-D CRISPR-associated protein Cas5/Csc1 n=1 Tax=Baaleninema simplex TaxID=2862350 RepID=UPI00036B3B85|nr:type I-D CRISPR-associated protein Cas5/Csc1 [Baaleninema simplex]
MLYACTLTLHDNVFFATREMGTLYETEKYLHNWALSYALFSVSHIPQPYRVKGKTAQKPSYLDEEAEQSLHHLNQAGIYVFPARPLSWSYQINTFKAAQSTYYGRSKQFGEKGADRNYPINYGRAKELAVNSRYRTYILTAGEKKISIPQWIRLGKWAAKVRVEAVEIPSSLVRARQGEYLCDRPLNPLDLDPSTQWLLYDRVVMPPVSLFSQAQLSGNYWEVAGNAWENWKRERSLDLENAIRLPRDVRYGASYVATA